MREVLFFALILVCPVAMFLMMRGGCGHGGLSHTTLPHSSGAQPLSTEELKRDAAISSVSSTSASATAHLQATRGR
jgi:Protein of unknown function (DUF2933)